MWSRTKQTREQSSRTVTRPSADFQTKFLRRVEKLKKKLKKIVAKPSRDSGRRSRDRRPTVKQRFLDITSNLEIFWKKSPNGHATVVGGHATVVRLSDKVISTFQAIRKIFQKRHWTVTRQWSEVPRPSADCQTTFFDVSSNQDKFWKSQWTVTRQWSEVTRPSTDCQTTVLDVSSS